MIKLDACILVGRDDENLARYLEAFNRLTFKPNTLIMVVDMNFRSDLPVVHTIEGVNLIILKYKGGSKQPQMRNFAVRASDADFIWFMDDDVSLSPSSCSDLIKTIGDLYIENIGCIAGKIVEQRDYDPSHLKYPIELNSLKGTIGYFEAALSDFSDHKYNFIKSKSGKLFPCIDFPQGTSMVFNRKLLISAGGFNETLGIDYASYEDSEPSFALKKRGFVTIYAPTFELYHHKLIRIDGTTRTNPTLKYQYSLIRNHSVALVGNFFPTITKSILFSIGFFITQTARFVIRHKSNPIVCVKGISISIAALVGGLILGFKTRVLGRGNIQ